MAKNQKTLVKKPYRSKAHPGKKNQPKSFHKVYWPFIPSIVMIALCGLMIFSQPARQVIDKAVLAYSTEMSRTGLLSSTNAERTSRGLGALSINSKLNQAAQNKANDMVARDYWSHNTPDGKEPWVFFDAVGYAYQKAGENLAYGFSTSSATVTGWMNSPGHRANILDSNYQEVGFGFANAPNYVGTGEETIVVAMYAKPQVLAATTTENTSTPATTTPPAPTQSTQAQSSAPKPTAQNSEPVQLPSEVVVEKSIEETTEQEQATPVSADTPFTSELAAGTEAQPTQISRIQTWTKGAAPWSAAALSVVALLVAMIWILKHALIVKRALIHGEEWVLHHPLVDFGVLTFVTAAVYLTTTSGIIR